MQASHDSLWLLPFFNLFNNTVHRYHVLPVTFSTTFLIVMIFLLPTIWQVYRRVRVLGTSDFQVASHLTGMRQTVHVLCSCDLHVIVRHNWAKKSGPLKCDLYCIHCIYTAHNPDVSPKDK